MTRKIALFGCFFSLLSALAAQTPPPVARFLQAAYMKGASFSLMMTEVQSGRVVCRYDADRELIPASVLKTVTTATALELLGTDYRFATTLEYDGEIRDGVLHGNLYIRGSGDPTLGSEHTAADRDTYTPAQNTFAPAWIAAVRKAGIRRIAGSVVADESCLDTEGVSPKWAYEDMGNYYGAGSYGVNAFDNLYRLTLRSGAAGTRPDILAADPAMEGLAFHNYLKAAAVSVDSAYILGAPFARERFLYGVVPANRNAYTLRGDIPDPPLFLAAYLTGCLQREGVAVAGSPSCHRILAEAGAWKAGRRDTLCTTYSPTLAEIVRVTNHVSHNLYADALLKVLGQRYRPLPGETLSAFGRGVRVVEECWRQRGLDTSGLRMYDGSGLAPADKVSARFVAGVLAYMAVRSGNRDAFVRSLPQAGVEGSVRNFLRGTHLQGKARLKSGGMTGVRSYAGYLTLDGKRYAVSLFVNNYACEPRVLLPDIENMLTALSLQLGQ